MPRDPSPADELRLECARLAAVFSDGDRVENARRLYSFIRGEEVLDRLHEHCRGKHAALAHEAGVSEPYVSSVFARTRPPCGKLLGLIGYRRVTAYEPIPNEQPPKPPAVGEPAEGRVGADGGICLSHHGDVST